MSNKEVTNIKYTFIGDINQKLFLGDYPKGGDGQSFKDAKQIFDRLCKGNNKKFDDRNKLVGNSGNYFFTVSNQNIFFLILAQSEYQERYVFELINTIQSEGITNLRNEQGVLSMDGLNKLQTVIAKYQVISSITAAQNSVNELKVEMNKNIQKALDNREDIENLDEKALKIKNGALEFQENANELKKVTWWQNVKYIIIIVAIVVAVLLAIILPICLKS